MSQFNETNLLFWVQLGHVGIQRNEHVFINIKYIIVIKKAINFFYQFIITHPKILYNRIIKHIKSNKFKPHPNTNLHSNQITNFQSMSDSQSLLSQKVKIMDSSISFDLTLSFSDVMNDLTCSKEQIARRFKLLVQQKQVHLRKEITDINTMNLKILQEKTTYFDQVKKTNQQLKEQISKKNTHIQSLSNQVKSLQQQIQELNKTIQTQQQRFRKFQQHTLQDYKRLQTIERKYKQLLNEIQEQKERKNDLQRKVDTMKNEKINWGDRIAYLIQNRQKGLMQEYKQEINNLKDILLFYQQDNKLLKQQLIKEKQTFTESKEGYEYLLKTLQQKYGLQTIPKYHHFKTQTEQNSIKRIDVATEITVQCYECRKISDLARHFTRKSVTVQTMKDPRKFAENQTQTDFVKFMDLAEETIINSKIKEIFTIAEKQKLIYQRKLNELQSILSNQPSKLQDLKTIAKLHNKIMEKERTIELMKNQQLTLKSLNTILHSQLQALKIQLKDGNQVRIDSLEFKKKSATLRLFTEEADEKQNESKLQKLETGPQIKPHVTNQKRFTRTVDLNSTRKTFSHCKSRVTAVTPESRLRDSKQKLSDTFRTTNADSFRWQKFEQKLKNPELFSPSPYVNAVRRQKYKKFSSLKKKRQHESDHVINFTVAF